MSCTGGIVEIEPQKHTTSTIEPVGTLDDQNRPASEVPAPRTPGAEMWDDVENLISMRNSNHYPTAAPPTVSCAHNNGLGSPFRPFADNTELNFTIETSNLEGHDYTKGDPIEGQHLSAQRFFNMLQAITRQSIPDVIRVNLAKGFIYHALCVVAMLLHGNNALCSCSAQDMFGEETFQLSIRTALQKDFPCDLWPGVEMQLQKSRKVMFLLQECLVGIKVNITHLDAAVIDEEHISRVAHCIVCSISAIEGQTPEQKIGGWAWDHVLSKFEKTSWFNPDFLSHPEISSAEDGTSIEDGGGAETAGPSNMSSNALALPQDTNGTPTERDPSLYAGNVAGAGLADGAFYPKTAGGRADSLEVQSIQCADVVDKSQRTGAADSTHDKAMHDLDSDIRPGSPINQNGKVGVGKSPQNMATDAAHPPGKSNSSSLDNRAEHATQARKTVVDQVLSSNNPVAVTKPQTTTPSISKSQSLGPRDGRPNESEAALFENDTSNPLQAFKSGRILKIRNSTATALPKNKTSVPKSIPTIRPSTTKSTDGASCHSPIMIEDDHDGDSCSEVEVAKKRRKAQNTRASPRKKNRQNIHYDTSKHPQDELLP